MKYGYYFIYAFMTYVYLKDIYQFIPSDSLHRSFIVFFLIALLVTFSVAKFAKSGSVNSTSSASELELYLKLYSFDGNIYQNGNICRTCKIEKAARSRHCSLCGRCIIRHEHHCFWLNTCIGRYNIRFFYLFLLTHIVYITYSFGLTLAHLIEYLCADGQLSDAFHLAPDSLYLPSGQYAYRSPFRFKYKATRVSSSSILNSNSISSFFHACSHAWKHYPNHIIIMVLFATLWLYFVPLFLTQTKHMVRNTTTSQLSKQQFVLLQFRKSAHKVINQNKIAANAESEPPIGDKFASTSARLSGLRNKRRPSKDVNVDQLIDDSAVNNRSASRKKHKQLQKNPYDCGLWMNMKEFWFPE